MTLELIDPPAGLYNKIINRIHVEERILVIKRIVIFSLLLVVSVGGFFPAITMLLSDLKRTGFLEFLSLLFSDSTIIMTYWQTFIMTILESLPALSLAFVLAALAAFLQSVKYLSHDVKKIIKVTI